MKQPKKERYRPKSETLLAYSAIIYALPNYIFLFNFWYNSSPNLGFILLDIAFNSLLVFIGYLSLASRPKSRAQQLAAAWFFAPFLSHAYEFDYLNLQALENRFMLIYILLIFSVIIWAFVLAFKQSKFESQL